MLPIQERLTTCEKIGFHYPWPFQDGSLSGTTLAGWAHCCWDSDSFTQAVGLVGSHLPIT
jgi:hypothetical protein